MAKVFEYLDYRTFLSDFYQEYKSINPNFSYRYIGKKVGMDHSLLVKVLLGKRHISNTKISLFIGFCKLDKRESEYFTQLVAFCKSKKNEDIKKHFEKLLSLKKYPSQTVEFEQYQYYQKWYYSAIRASLEYFKFKNSYSELAKHVTPAITPKEAKEAITLLKSLGFIKLGKKGYYDLTESHLTSGEVWKPQAIKNYQRETIKLSEESLERHAKELRDVSSITMAINGKDIEGIKEQLKRCRESIISLVGEIKDPNCVYQLNLQLIPLTHVSQKAK